MRAVQILAVQVGVSTIAVPPGTFAINRTVATASSVVIAIFGAEVASIVMSQAVPCGVEREKGNITNRNNNYDLTNLEKIYNS